VTQAGRPNLATGLAAAPSGRLVYAIGDCHGCLDLLLSLESKIVADASGKASTSKIIVYLGDYIDRGPDSASVLDHLVAGPPPGFEAAYLLGNHEEMLLQFLYGSEERALLWLLNGGKQTLISYGLDLTGLEAEGALETLRSELRARIPGSHLVFLENLKLTHEEGDFLFVHAGLRPGVSLPAQRREDMLWVRDAFLKSSQNFGRIVVHGHTPDNEPVERPNRIGIDTGAVYSGTLTALALEGTARHYIQVHSSEMPGTKHGYPKA
jgi:serine/threonine protein phosphatase 1